MTGAERRTDMLERIKSSQIPVSGKRLAGIYGVSRQVIVQDIALIRASGHDIISTNRGYLLNALPVVSRIFKVSHTDDQMEEEMLAIVDLGGRIINVVIHHKVYGTLEADLSIGSRRKVMEFMEGIRNGKSSPLKNITSNYHYHKVEAESEETLNLIEKTLREKGFLVE
ncbi:MAG: transcription repressor NadR [Lachnospiraceae bacterium]|nr:transcription repressor NadR [Lachnospiraceae bacterium]